MAHIFTQLIIVVCSQHGNTIDKNPQIALLLDTHEANVYHAVNADGQDRAVKIYKTSILHFKDRDRYVSGDFKFRHGYSKHNPRKMVRTWAEKETSNLFKLYQAGLPCPEPVLLRSHVLVMGFLGQDSVPAPRLKDADFSESKARELYYDIVVNMWIMYKECRIIHADLNEFNLLYHNGRAYIIDVSQSVTPDHPHSLEFLRKDCTNITEYFRKKGVPTMTVRELFNFLVDPNVTHQNREKYLEKMKEIGATRKVMTPEELIEEEVFKNMHIPKTLNQVIDFERDMKALKLGEKTEKDIAYHTIIGLKEDLSGAATQPKILHCEEEESGDEASEDDDENDDEDDVNKGKARTPGRPRAESPNARKERKKAIKEAQAEKRKNKIKKHVKKRAEKEKRKKH
ncbi:RIO kinase 1 [Oratosquilla oratoria]|uniref:RIO kinase 1 n=1 Tax=Oratosquilla oratoria TaxID=337810 RepID=UPI003F7606F0